MQQHDKLVGFSYKIYLNYESYRLYESYKYAPSYHAHLSHIIWSFVTPFQLETFYLISSLTFFSIDQQNTRMIHDTFNWIWEFMDVWELSSF